MMGSSPVYYFFKDFKAPDFGVNLMGLSYRSDREALTTVMCCRNDTERRFPNRRCRPEWNRSATVIPRPN